ncbi:MAG: hypothetical protein HN867_08465 [Deltaproteobacteria bacterium]|nr:hypothetical protein [Deltaproteobacteria bacterium]
MSPAKAGLTEEEKLPHIQIGRKSQTVHRFEFSQSQAHHHQYTENTDTTSAVAGHAVDHD